MALSYTLFDYSVAFYIKVTDIFQGQLRHLSYLRKYMC